MREIQTSVGILAGDEDVQVELLIQDPRKLTEISTEDIGSQQRRRFERLKQHAVDVLDSFQKRLSLESSKLEKYEKMLLNIAESKADILGYMRGDININAYRNVHPE